MGARVRELFAIGVVVAAVGMLRGGEATDGAASGLAGEAQQALLAYRDALAASFSRAAAKIEAGEIRSDYDCGQYLQRDVAAGRAEAFRPLNERLSALKDLEPEQWRARAAALNRQIASALRAASAR